MENILNVDFSNFQDSFGNLIKEFEVIQYCKLSNNEWQESNMVKSGRSYYIIDNNLYYRCGRDLLPLNMDFESKTCGTCYKIGKEIISKKITGNEILFICETDNGIDRLSLHKQSYSDNTCFYTLKNNRNQVKFADSDINEMKKEIENIINIKKERLEGIKNKDDYEFFAQMQKTYIKQLENVICELKKVA